MLIGPKIGLVPPFIKGIFLERFKGKVLNQTLKEMTQVNQKLPPLVKKAREHNYVAFHPGENCRVNLRGDYDYLEMAYYISQDIENEGGRIHPTCQEMLDAYIPPLFLEKARLSGIDVPAFYVSNGYFEPPVIIDPINPFMFRSRTVFKNGRQEATARSMTRNFKYAVCCQELPPNAEIRRFRSVLGWCVSPRYRPASETIWRTFRIPLAKVRVVITESGEMLLSDIAPLDFEDLRQRELAYIEKQVRWDE